MSHFCSYLFICCLSSSSPFFFSPLSPSFPPFIHPHGFLCFSDQVKKLLYVQIPTGSDKCSLGSNSKYPVENLIGPAGVKCLPLDHSSAARENRLQGGKVPRNLIFYEALLCTFSHSFFATLWSKNELLGSGTWNGPQIGKKGCRKNSWESVKIIPHI